MRLALVSLALPVFAAACVGCASPPDAPAAPTAPAALEPVPVAAEPTVAPAAAPLSADGYYTAAVDAGNNNIHEIGLTITGETAELVYLSGGEAPFTGYTTLAVRRDGNDVILGFVSNTDSNGAAHTPAEVGAEVLRLTLVEGAKPKTTWGAYKPSLPVIRGFEPAEPDVLGP